jgi:flagellar L-ring protein FlgH
MTASCLWSRGFAAALLICAVNASWADSLFTAKAEKNGSLVSNKRAKFEVGDIVTVLVQESIDASTQSNTDTRKDSSTEAEASVTPGTLLPSVGIEDDVLPNWEIELENQHRSTGQTQRKNRLVTTISCLVTKVYENGNIDIQGAKTVTVNRESSDLVLVGTVRGRDVTAANTIMSSQVTNMKLHLKGEGPLWKNQRRGLFTKLLDFISPF